MSDSVAPRRARLGFGFWSFIAFMLVLTALFAGLGVWQVERLAEKDALIADVADRLNDRPYDVPALDRWSGSNFETFAFHPVTASGHYLNDKTVLVFTSLSEAKGSFSGPGYWVMTPFALEGGGVVFVNRGFIPQSSASAFAGGAAGPAGDQTVTGIALHPEATGPFTPGPDTANRIEWVRDPVRLGAMAGITDPLLPLTIDLPAGEAGALPQGGETVVEFPNNHLGYAFTWFGFALLTPVLLAAWVYRQLRPAPKSPPA